MPENKSNKHHKTAKAAIIFTAAIIAAALPHLWWDATYFFTTVTPAKFYRSKVMPPDRLAAICAKKGIRTVIDLRDTRSKEGRKKERLLQSIAKEKKALENIGVTYFNVEAGQSENNKAAFEKYLQILDRTNSWPALVHCKDGVGRSGVSTALYLMEYENADNKEALKQAAEWKTYRLKGRKNFRRGKKKAELILNYTPRS